MLWLKKKYEIKVKGGRGWIATEPMHGMIVHLMVVPHDIDMIWSMDIKDSQNDVIYQIKDHEGRLDEKGGLPVGVDKQEQLMLEIYDTTSNNGTSVIFKVRENL